MYIIRSKIFKMSLYHTTRLAPSSVFVRWKDLEPYLEVSERSDPDPELKSRIHNTVAIQQTPEKHR
jgi:hypothetical protein